MLNNDSTLSSSLNVSERTILSNDTTVYGRLNISGYTTLNNNVAFFIIIKYIRYDYDRK